MITSTLAQLQTAVAAMLTIDHAFNGTDSANGKAVPVITEKIGDIVAHLNQQIAQIGLAVVITVPPFRNENSKVNSITSWVTLMIQVSELVMVNQGSKGTQIPASVLVCRICELLHWKSHNTVSNVDQRMQVLEFQDAILKITPTQSGTMTRDITYLMKFNTRLVIKTL